MKDTDNLSSYNIWSAGDYTESLQDFERTSTSNLTNTYSTIGEHCICLKATSSNWWISLPFNLTSTGTYTVSMNILCPTGATLRFINNNQIISQVDIPQLTSWKEVTISAQLSSLTNPSVYIMNYGGGAIFFDDVVCVKA